MKKIVLATVCFLGFCTVSHAGLYVRGEGTWSQGSTSTCGTLTCEGGGHCADVNGSFITFWINSRQYWGHITSTDCPMVSGITEEDTTWELEDVGDSEGNPPE